MSWLFEADFGSGYSDITQYTTGAVSKYHILHKDLKAVLDTCTFQIFDKSVANQFNTATSDINVRITKDSVIWFRGIARPNYQTIVFADMQAFRIEVVELGYLLNKKINSNIKYANYTLCDPANKSTSLLHQLFYLAGISDTDINFTAINKVIDYFVVEASDKVSYIDKIRELLWEYGYTFYFDPVNGFQIFDLFPTSISATAIDDKSLYDSLTYRRVEESYEMVRVSLSPHITKTNIIVYSNNEGADSDHKCNITLAAGEYYPANSNLYDTYLTYKMQDDGYDIIVVNNAVLDIEQSGVTTNEFTPYYKKAKIQLYSSGGGSITKLDIVGDAVLKDKLNRIIVVKEIVPGTEKIYDYECKYLQDKTDGDRLASGLADWYRYNDYTYEFVGYGFEVGGYYELTENVMGFVTKIRVVQITENQEGVQKIVAEGIDNYSLTGTTVEQSGTNSNTPPEKQYEQASPTYDEIIETGWNIGLGTTTPTQVVINKCEGHFKSTITQWDKQQNLTNFERYEVQVSNDQSSWYDLKFDGTDWKGTLDGVTEWYNEYLVHPNIPLGGTADNPVGITLYYRVRRVTKAGVLGSWSTAASATTKAVNSGELAQDSVYANNIRTGVLNALVANIRKYIQISDSSGFSGQTYDQRLLPSVSDKRTYLDKDELRFQENVADWTGWNDGGYTNYGAADKVVDLRKVSSKHVLALRLNSSSNYKPNIYSVELSETGEQTLYLVGNITTNDVYFNMPFRSIKISDTRMVVYWTRSINDVMEHAYGTVLAWDGVHPSSITIQKNDQLIDESGGTSPQTRVWGGVQMDIDKFVVVYRYSDGLSTTYIRKIDVEVDGTFTKHTPTDISLSSLGNEVWMMSFDSTHGFFQIMFGTSSIFCKTFKIDGSGNITVNDFIYTPISNAYYRPVGDPLRYDSTHVLAFYYMDDDPSGSHAYKFRMWVGTYNPSTNSVSFGNETILHDFGTDSPNVSLEAKTVGWLDDTHFYIDYGAPNSTPVYEIFEINSSFNVTSKYYGDVSGDTNVYYEIGVTAPFSNYGFLCELKKNDGDYVINADYTTVSWVTDLLIGGDADSSIPRISGDNTDIILKPASGGQIVFDVNDTSWHNVGESGEPAFENGWINRANQIKVGFKLDPFGNVELKGVADATNATADTIFTLPVGYRPAARYYIGADSYDGTTSKYAEVSIHIDGTVNTAHGSIVDIKLNSIFFGAGVT